MAIQGELVRMCVSNQAAQLNARGSVSGKLKGGSSVDLVSRSGAGHSLMLTFAAFVLEHATISMKDCTGFDRQGASSDIAVDYCARPQLDPFTGDDIAIDHAANYRYRDFDIGIQSCRRIDD